MTHKNEKGQHLTGPSGRRLLISGTANPPKLSRKGGGGLSAGRSGTPPNPIFHDKRFTDTLPCPLPISFSDKHIFMDKDAD